MKMKLRDSDVENGRVLSICIVPLPIACAMLDVWNRSRLALGILGRKIRCYDCMS
jgi:hypothetical protein